MNANTNNRKVLWLSLAGLALLGAVTVYALTNSNGSNPLEEGPLSALGGAVDALGDRVTIPAGTAIAMTLQTTLSTKTALVGDRFTATVGAPVIVAGQTIIPAGAEVEGHVTFSEQPGKASGRGKLQLLYDTVRYDGHAYDLDSKSRVYESASGRGKDAALIGGGAVVGGVAGAVLGGSAKDAGKGAVAGAGAGTAASLLTRGPQLVLEPGTSLMVTLDHDVTVRPAKTA